MGDYWLNTTRLVHDSLIVLALMFVWTFVDIARRGSQSRAAKRRSRIFLKAIQELLRQGNWDGILALAESDTQSHVAAVYLNALREFRKVRACGSAEDSVEAAERGARVAANRMHEQLRRGLHTLGTIATTAPLVGLSGTCIGLLDSFRGFEGPLSVFRAFLATRTSEALAPTAIGLVVAVVAVWWFNWRSARLEVFDGEMQIASQELVKYLEIQRRVGNL